MAGVVSSVMGSCIRRFRYRLWVFVHRWSGELLDFRYGVETARSAPLESFGLWAPMRGEYQPAGWRCIRAALGAIHVTGDEVLLDAGSGKGRVVLAASALPFGRVMGVELVPAMHALALDNLERYRGPRRCKDIQLTCGDATALPLPDDVTHVFLNNPFEGDLFDRFLDRVMASVDRNPRRISVIYLNPTGGQRILARGARARSCAPNRRHWDIAIYDLGPDTVGARDGSDQ